MWKAEMDLSIGSGSNFPFQTCLFTDLVGRGSCGNKQKKERQKQIKQSNYHKMVTALNVLHVFQLGILYIGI